MIIGIDPGLDGAIALLSDSGDYIDLYDTPTISVKKSKGNKRNFASGVMVGQIENCITRAVHQAGKVTAVVIENVHAMPGQGVTSMFSMGRGFGIWEGIITALKLPLVFIEPKKWKTTIGIPPGSDKGAAILMAQRLFPKAAPSLSRKKDHGRADALLIAECYRRSLQQQKKAKNEYLDAGF